MVRHVSASRSWPLRCEARCERGVRHCIDLVLKTGTGNGCFQELEGEMKRN